MGREVTSYVCLDNTLFQDAQVFKGVTKTVVTTVKTLILI